MTGASRLFVMQQFSDYVRCKIFITSIGLHRGAAATDIYLHLSGQKSFLGLVAWNSFR